MEYFSTSDPSLKVSFREAVLSSLTSDFGLFLPSSIPVLPPAFFDSLPSSSFLDIARTVCAPFLAGTIEGDDLNRLLADAFTFPAPLVPLTPTIGALELFHGPTCAFKDFGASFLAAVTSHLLSDTGELLLVIVATSGDTGGAVARAFFSRPRIAVAVLYPRGKVSPIQERQLTTLGENIHAFEIDATFDTCQALAKELLVDDGLRLLAQERRCTLTSANSVNVARLIPQSLYYFSAYGEALALGVPKTQPIIFSTPSGNFGNITGGVFAQRMGLPIRKLVAATNINRTVPDYLDTGIFSPRPSVRTVSNAMDVGNPNNFPRLLALCGAKLETMRETMLGFSFTNRETLSAIERVFAETGYVLDPHGAVGYLGLEKAKAAFASAYGIFLHTAHPAKFPESVRDIVGGALVHPPQLASLPHEKKNTVSLGPEYPVVRSRIADLLGNLS